MITQLCRYTDIHSSSPMFSWDIKVSIRCTLRNLSRSSSSPEGFSHILFREFWEFGHTTLFIYRFFDSSVENIALFKNSDQPDIATDSTMVWVWGGAMHLSDQWQNGGGVFRKKLCKLSSFLKLYMVRKEIKHFTSKEIKLARIL